MDPFLGEIRIFSGNFEPRGWAMCNGQLLPISQNTAVFSLLGTTYGGDGRTTFGLPDLRQRVPLHPGQGPGLSDRQQGESGGQDSVTLSNGEMAQHTHTLQAASVAATSRSAAGNLLAPVVAPVPPYHAPVGMKPMQPGVLGAAGGGAPHDNMQPYLVLNFIIALQGIYPPRP
jgi:microcystin-dependent protein